LCLFGRFARCLIGGRPRGVGCCLRSKSLLQCSFANVSAVTTLHRLCEIIESLYRAELTVHSSYIWLEC
jgi:hypothetical protein